MSVEDLVYVETSEISSIEGFDEDTAIEIQARAKTSMEQEIQKQEERRKELGVSDELLQIEGMDTNMLVVLGENNIKSLDDFAGFSTDELYGWVEKTELGSKKQEGLFSGFDLNRDQVEKMILDSRVKLGWIQNEDLSEETEANMSENTSEEKKIDISEKLANARILK